jgi:hypothetical protein
LGGISFKDFLAIAICFKNETTFSSYFGLALSETETEVSTVCTSCPARLVRYLVVEI